MFSNVFYLIIELCIIIVCIVFTSKSKSLKSDVEKSSGLLKETIQTIKINSKLEYSKYISGKNYYH